MKTASPPANFRSAHPPLRKRISRARVRRVFRIRRDVTYNKDGRKRKTETACFITSLSAEEAGPQRLLQLVRGDWGAVENGMHSVRDESLSENASRLHKGALPRPMTAFANLVISILRLGGRKNIRRARKRLARQADRVALQFAHS